MKLNYSLFTLLFLLMNGRLVAQVCPIDVDAGPDIHYCQGDPNPELSGSISGDYLSFVWSPAAGLSSTTVLDPSVTMGATNKTYILTGTGLTANMVQNGDFEQGNTGFVSSYVYSATNLVPEGVYTVNDNPNNVHPGFQPCADHTSGSGQMMVVNGSGTPNVVVWGQTVSVVPNMVYRFSYWGCSVVSGAPAQQVFRINGVNIGPTLVFPTATCSWVEFSCMWNSGGSSSANLQLINLNTTLGGNDYAIDDIEFQKQCTDTDTVKIFSHPTFFKTISATICAGDFYQVGNEFFGDAGQHFIGLESEWGCDSIIQLNLQVIELDANITPTNPTIDCQNQSVLLTSAGSATYPGSTFNWSTTNGNFSGSPNAPQITANSTGQYQLVLKFQNAQLLCTDTTKVTVTASALPPLVNAGPTATIGCTSPTATLAGQAGGAPNLSYSWTTPNGNFVGGQTTLAPAVNAAGQYILTATNPANGCTASDTTTVNQDLSVPISNAGPGDTLSCLIHQFNLNGMASTGPTFQFTWSTPNGHFVSGINSLQPLIDQPGQYFLTVVNTANGCSAISSATFLIDTVQPLAEAGPSFTLDCLTTFDTLSGNSDGNFQPIWTTVGGHFVSDQNTFMPVVDAAGLYFLETSNSINGCKSKDSVIVTINNQPPAIDAGPPITLTCSQPTAILQATMVPTGPIPVYSWTTNGGAFSGPQNVLNPTATAPGQYILTATNPTNGCTTFDQTTVTADPNIPVVDIAAPDTLSCFLNKQTLVASANGAGLTASWTTVGGSFLNGQNTFSPEINAPGSYTILVSNPANGCTTVATISVFENVQPPVAQAVATYPLDCTTPFLPIDGNGSSQGISFSHAWTTVGGNFLNGQNTPAPIVNQPGSYTLVVTDLTNGCTASATVQVLADFAEPLLEIAAPDTLDCLVLQTQLDATGSQTGQNILYKWTTTGGSILSGDTTLAPIINAPGIYVLTITNWINGCKSTGSVEVFENTQPPVAVIQPPGELTCANLSVQLITNGSSVGQNFLYNWTENGSFFSSENEPTTSQPGQFFLEITDSKNGCTVTTSTTILENKTPPTVDAGPGQTLNCSIASLNLNGSASSQIGSVSLNWTTLGGQILSGAATNSPLIDAPGWYFLTVLDNQNGCSVVDSVQVLPDSNAPTVAILLPGLLTCTAIQLNLNASASAATGGNLQQNWTTTDGQILSGAASLTPTIGQPGTYILTVTDLSNNCKTVATTTVSEDIQPPTVSFSGSYVVTCANPTGQLTGNISSLGNDFSFVWQTANGQFAAGQTTLSPTVSAPGNYLLTATDQSNGCTASASTTVLENTQPPVALVFVAGPLTCSQPTINLTTPGSSAGPGFGFLWTTAGGSFVSGQNSMSPTVGSIGTYSLTINDFANGCTASGSVLVTENKTPPLAEFLSPEKITCAKPTVVLTGIGTGFGPLSAKWQTQNGQFVGPTNTFLATVSKPGQYFLIITDGANGCTDLAQVDVEIDTLKPAIFIAPPGKLTCTELTVLLNAAASSSGPNFPFSWTTTGGNFASGQNSLTPTVDQIGSYSLIINNLANGCSSSKTVQVSENKTPPPADAGPDQTLTCQKNQATLGQPGGQNFQFDWQTAGGHFASGQTAAQPVCDEPGGYFLTVTDPQNGCTTTDEVEIFEEKLTGGEVIATPPGCVGQPGKLEILNFSGGTAPIEFSIDGQIWQSSPLFENLPSGSYTASLRDAGGCVLNRLAFIPQGIDLQLVVENGVTVSLGESWQLEAFVNVPTGQLASIEWTPATTLSCADCLRPVATPIEATTYEIMVVDTNGCRDEATVVLNVKTPGIYVPNVITLDGLHADNQSLTIFADPRAVVKINELRVFSRWGELVFSAQNFPPSQPELGFGGTLRGQILTPGVFVWWAEIEWLDGRRQFLSGDVTVVK